MIYSEAINYIKNIERAGVDLGIERMRELMRLLGSPDKRLRFVHVAGTNGKGSVTAYLTSVLKAAGHKVGTYNSPSVFCYNERWLIDGEPLCNDDVARFMTVIRDALDAENSARGERGESAIAPTSFEIETALAFCAFDAYKCDVCVLEVGLGGRWDATNVIEDKLLSVITPIGLDHCAILGNTLGEIAAEKAAIINGTVVTCEQCDEVMREIRNPYIEVDGKKVPRPSSPIVCKKPVLIESSLAGQIFLYDGKCYKIAMLGEHQLTNAAIAICAAEQLRKAGVDISDDALQKGMATAVWHGRFEIINSQNDRFNINIIKDKTLILDGAHNPHGANVLAAAIKKYFAAKRVHLVMGVLKDKDVDGIVSILAPLALRAYAVDPPSPRALEGSVLAEKINKYVPCGYDKNSSIRSTVKRALEGDCDVVLLAGSLTLFNSLGENYGG